MRFRIRRDRKIHPLAYREARPPLRPSEGEVEASVPQGAPSAPPPGNLPRVAEPEMTVPPPPPIAPFPNGLRAQATAGDGRAERLVRGVRLEVADLKQAIDSWSETRDDMLDIDLDAIRAYPAAAATLPPGALVRALLEAADRVAELEGVIQSRESTASALREELSRMHEEHSYAQGRLETLQEVIAALHANLEDLRYDRQRQAAIEPPSAPRALRPADADADPFGMGGAFR